MVAIGYHVNKILWCFFMTIRDPQINIRLPAELKEQLHELAAKNRRSVNSQVVAAIEAIISLDQIENEIASMRAGQPPKSIPQKKYTFTEQELHDFLCEATSLALKNIK